MNYKVWIIEGVDKHDTYVLYVASTEDLAYKYVDENPSLECEYLYGVKVSEWVVDSPCEPEPKEEEDG